MQVQGYRDYKTILLGRRWRPERALRPLGSPSRYTDTQRPMICSSGDGWRMQATHCIESFTHLHLFRLCRRPVG